MCGRYASARKRLELLEEFRIERDRVAEPIEPDYNVAPTKRVYAVVTRDAQPSEGAGAAEARSAEARAAQAAPAGTSTGGTSTGGDQPQEITGVARELRVVRWGLVPFWAKDPSIGSRLINARAETVASKPAFRRAFSRRRCLLPADGYYEWQRPGEAGSDDTPGGRGKGGKGGAKQPYFIFRRDGGPLAFAGLYELWRDESVPDDHEHAWLWTATIITTSAPDELGKIHERMPMIIEPDRWADWLDPESKDPADLMSLLAPAAAGGLDSYPVSTAVNSVRNNGPHLLERIDPGQVGQDPSASAGSRRSRSAASQGTSGSVPDKLF